MATFTNLRKLDLGRNKLTKTDGLEGLVMLTELSLEALFKTQPTPCALADFDQDCEMSELHLPSTSPSRTW